MRRLLSLALWLLLGTAVASADPRSVLTVPFTDYSVGSQAIACSYYTTPLPALTSTGFFPVLCDAPGTLRMSSGGSATVVVPATAANVVVKASPGRLVKALVTTAGTSVNVVCFDNASAASGTTIAVVPATAAVGTVVDFSMPAANGITCSTSATSPVVTLSYY